MLQIMRASAGNVKRTKEEMDADPEQEDEFGYTNSEYLLVLMLHVYLIVKMTILVLVYTPSKCFVLVRPHSSVYFGKLLVPGTKSSLVGTLENLCSLKKGD